MDSRAQNARCVTGGRMNPRSPGWLPFATAEEIEEVEEAARELSLARQSLAAALQRIDALKARRRRRPRRVRCASCRSLVKWDRDRGWVCVVCEVGR